MNLTQAGLSTSFSLDAVNRQLSNNATSNVSFDPTSRARVSAHETDKQSEDNATWYFEYRALLNSKLTTLITSLTSAYTTDLDASMGAKNPAGGTKNSMQGLTGSLVAPYTNPAAGDRPVVDPGAARTTVAYMTGFGTYPATIAPTIIPFTAPHPVVKSAGPPIIYFTDALGNNILVSDGGWAGSDTGVSDQTTSLSINFTSNDVGGAAATVTSQVTGTTTFMSGGKTDFLLDNLHVNMDPYNFPPNVSGLAPQGMGIGFGNYNYYENDKAAELSSYNRDTTDTTDAVKNTRNIGNNLEFTLYKFFERPENLDLIRFGFFKDVYVVGTSSLPTGSQVQGSLSMDWDQINGKIKIKQERYAAFFHS